MARSITDGLVMFKLYDNITIGRFKYDMPESFAEDAISAVTDICSQPNVFCDGISNSPVVSFWNVNDKGKRLYDLPVFKDYLTFVKPLIRDYLKELNLSEDDAVVAAMWGVHYKPNQFVQKHNHEYTDYIRSPFEKRGKHKVSTDNDILAILLYLNKPDNSGNLFIQSKKGIKHEFDLKAGDIIMFPSYSSIHWTEPNLSEEEKFVVGIEIVMKWVTSNVIVGKTIEEL